MNCLQIIIIFELCTIVFLALVWLVSGWNKYRYYCKTHKNFKGGPDGKIDTRKRDVAEKMV